MTETETGRQIGRDEIAALIPHAGDMCLLSSVRVWNGTRIVCEAESHHVRPHPLATNGGLHAVLGLEYAAQAMALHGCLSGAVGERPRAGYIASVRELKFSHPALDAAPGPLTVLAEKLAGDGATVMYRFAVSAAGEEILAGRAAVVLEGDPR